MKLISTNARVQDRRIWLEEGTPLDCDYVDYRGGECGHLTLTIDKKLTKGEQIDVKDPSTSDG